MTALGRTGVELLIALLLLYSFFAVPIQLSIWVNEDVCSLPPTQHFDMTTELIFMVKPIPRDLVVKTLLLVLST